MTENLAIRALTAADVDIICRHRQAMFQDMGRDPAAMAAPFRTWLEERLAEERYFGFMAERDGRVIGGVGLMVIDWPPHTSHPLQDRRGYVLNMYVEPDCRGAGLARALMRAAEDRFRAMGIEFLVLHASDAGRPIYESLGWQASSEMAKRL